MTPCGHRGLCLLFGGMAIAGELASVIDPFELSLWNATHPWLLELENYLGVDLPLGLPSA